VVLGQPGEKHKNLFEKKKHRKNTENKMTWEHGSSDKALNSNSITATFF
jgi:hypothetical protein